MNLFEFLAIIDSYENQDEFRVDILDKDSEYNQYCNIPEVMEGRYYIISHCYDPKKIPIDPFTAKKIVANDVIDGHIIMQMLYPIGEETDPIQIPDVLYEWYTSIGFKFPDSLIITTLPEEYQPSNSELKVIQND